MICPKCNTELKDGAKFCHVCGWKYEDVVTSQPQAQQNFSQPGWITPPLESELTDEMPSLIDRVKGILLKPKEEWTKIRLEKPNTSKLFTKYALIFILVAAVANFVGYAFVGIKVNLGFLGSYTVKGIDLGLYQTLVYVVSNLIGVFLTAFVIDILAPSFGAKKNFDRAFQLVTFAYIPSWIGGILFIYPGLSILVSLIGIYSLYQLCVGLSYTMFPPKDRKVGYIVVSIIVMCISIFVVALIIGAIFAGMNPIKAGFSL